MSLTAIREFTAPLALEPICRAEGGETNQLMMHGCHTLSPPRSRAARANRRCGTPIIRPRCLPACPRCPPFLSSLPSPSSSLFFVSPRVLPAATHRPVSSFLSFSFRSCSFRLVWSLLDASLPDPVLARSQAPRTRTRTRAIGDVVLSIRCSSSNNTSSRGPGQQYDHPGTSSSTFSAPQRRV